MLPATIREKEPPLLPVGSTDLEDTCRVSVWKPLQDGRSEQLTRRNSLSLIECSLDRSTMDRKRTLSELTKKEDSEEEEKFQYAENINPNSEAATSVGDVAPLLRTPSAVSSHSHKSTQEDESCFICLMEFEASTDLDNKKMIMPCAANCSTLPVHTKCIYEWRQRRESEVSTGTCPLCRGPLSEKVFSAMDMIKSAKFVMFSERKTFVTSPLPSGHDPMKCYVRVTYSSWTGLATKYELYLQAVSSMSYPYGALPSARSPSRGDQLLLTAKKRWNGAGGWMFCISLDLSCRKYDPSSPFHAGSVISSLSGLIHTLTAPHVDGTLTELACCMYQPNRVGSTIGPRKMHVCLPIVETTIGEGGEEVPVTSVFRQKGGAGAMSSLLQKGKQHVVQHPKLEYYENKKPRWLDQIQAYSLDFQGRVTLPSNKNFQLIKRTLDPAENRTNEEMMSSVVLQFGKVVGDKPVEYYTMDVTFPLSPLQAFGIALTACDRKLGCA